MRATKKSELGEAHSCDCQIKPCEAWKCAVLWKPMGFIFDGISTNSMISLIKS